MVDNETVKEVKKELDGVRGEIAEISVALHESEQYKKDKEIKLRDKIIIILFLLLVISNILWYIKNKGYEKVTETTETITTTTIEGVEQTADNGGDNNIVGGDFVNGDAESKKD